MSKEQELKNLTNHMFEALEKYNKGQCTYDKALEDAMRSLNHFMLCRPVVGYIQSSTLQEVCFSIYRVLHNASLQDKTSNVIKCEIPRKDFERFEKLLRDIAESENCYG